MFLPNICVLLGIGRDSQIEYSLMAGYAVENDSTLVPLQSYSQAVACS